MTGATAPKPEPPPETADEADEPDPEPPTPSPPARTVLPSERIGASNVAFMIDYPASAPVEAVRRACDAESEDPKTRAGCRAKGREKFVADVLVFEKDKAGRRWWVIYRRQGKTLLEVSKTLIEFGEETDTTIEIVVKGKSTGERPLFTGKKTLVLTVPGDSTVTIQDPKFGKLIYNAKIGLVGS